MLINCTNVGYRRSSIHHGKTLFFFFLAAQSARCRRLRAIDEPHEKLGRRQWALAATLDLTRPEVDEEVVWEKKDMSQSKAQNVAVAITLQLPRIGHETHINALRLSP